MAFVIPLVFIAGAAAIGIMSGAFTGCDDCAIEEATKEIMENQAENLLGLDDGSLNFDLTPDSSEKMEARIGPMERECLRHCGCFSGASQEMNE